MKSLLQAASVLMTQNGTERSDHYKKVPTKCQASLSLIFLIGLGQNDTVSVSVVLRLSPSVIVVIVTLLKLQPTV